MLGSRGRLHCGSAQLHNVPHAYTRVQGGVERWWRHTVVVEGARSRRQRRGRRWGSGAEEVVIEGGRMVAVRGGGRQSLGGEAQRRRRVPMCMVSGSSRGDRMDMGGGGSCGNF